MSQNAYRAYYFLSRYYDTCNTEQVMPEKEITAPHTQNESYVDVLHLKGHTKWSAVKCSSPIRAH